MAVEVSADSVIVKFPYKKLTSVKGEPAHSSITKAEKELGTDLIAVPCPWGHQKGYLGLLQLATLYLQQNGAAFNLPAAAPSSYPVIPVGSTDTERNQVRVAYQYYWARGFKPRLHELDNKTSKLVEEFAAEQQARI